MNTYVDIQRKNAAPINWSRHKYAAFELKPQESSLPFKNMVANCLSASLCPYLLLCMGGARSMLDFNMQLDHFRREKLIHKTDPFDKNYSLPFRKKEFPLCFWHVCLHFFQCFCEGKKKIKFFTIGMDCFLKVRWVSEYVTCQNSNCMYALF